MSLKLHKCCRTSEAVGMEEDGKLLMDQVGTESAGDLEIWPPNMPLYVREPAITCPRIYARIKADWEWSQTDASIYGFNSTYGVSPELPYDSATTKLCQGPPGEPPTSYPEEHEQAICEAGYGPNTHSTYPSGDDIYYCGYSREFHDQVSVQDLRNRLCNPSTHTASYSRYEFTKDNVETWFDAISWDVTLFVGSDTFTNSGLVYKQATRGAKLQLLVAPSCAQGLKMQLAFSITTKIAVPDAFLGASSEHQWDKVETYTVLIDFDNSETYEIALEFPTIEDPEWQDMGSVTWVQKVKLIEAAWV